MSVSSHQDDALPPDRLRRLTAVEYFRLVDAGWFRDERVELIDGLVVTMSPQGDPHAWITAWLGHHLSRTVDERFLVRQHSPLTVDAKGVPEPDLAVVPAQRTYAHPTGAVLVIEVADSSLDYDRTVKLPRYAAGGIPEYWIVDVDAEVVEVFTQPRGRVYTVHEVVGRDGRLRPSCLPTVDLAVEQLFATRER